MEPYFIIGSTVMKNYFHDFNRIPYDLDLLVKDENHLIQVKKVYKNQKKIDYAIIPPLYNYIKENGLSANVLLTLKCSHIFWPIKWEKTLFDINFMINKNTQIIESLFYELYEHWKLNYGLGHRSNLNVDAEKFFDNALKTYNHDYLHTIINPNPTYLKILKDKKEVDVDEYKFNLLTFKEKLDLVREEIYVMAFERRGKKSYRLAYIKMLKTFLMKHAPIWEALFIIKNFNILIRPEYDYFEKINQGLAMVQE